MLPRITHLKRKFPRHKQSDAAQRISQRKSEKYFFLPATRRRCVAENRVSCRQPGSNPLVIDHDAEAEKRIPISARKLGILQEGRVKMIIVKIHRLRCRLTRRIDPARPRALA
jgi:hypothetical protein